VTNISSESEVDKCFFDAVRDSIPKPSRLQQYSHVWRLYLQLLDNQEDAAIVLDHIENGLPSYFEGDIDKLPKSSRNSAPTKEIRMEITRQFTGMLIRGELEVLFKLPPTFCRIFTVPKDVVDYRMVRDFSIAFWGEHSLNEGIPENASTTIFPQFKQLVELALKVCASEGIPYLFADDGHSYYRQFYMRLSAQILMNYEWMNVWLRELRLPFGISSATQMIQRISEAIIEIMEKTLLKSRRDLHGLMVAYIDDFICFCPNEHDAWLLAACFKETCWNLGILLKPKKFKPPNIQNIVLGYHFDLVKEEVSIPIEKIGPMVQKIDDLLEKKCSSKKELERLIGSLNWYAQLVFPARSFLRRLIDVMISIPTYSIKDCPLSRGALLDLEWWRYYIYTLRPVPLSYALGQVEANEIRVFTDASDIGMGAWCEPHFFAILYNELPRDLRWLQFSSIMVRELAAVIFASQRWSNNWCNRKVNFIIDNQASFYAIKKVSSRSPHLMEWIRLLAQLSIDQRFRFYPSWIRSEHNTIADALSRNDVETFKIFTNHINGRVQDFVDLDWIADQLPL